MAALLRLSASVALIGAFIASSIAQDYDDVPENCKLPPKRGSGGWRFDFWYYDTKKSDCRWMAARSVFGNANRFVSRAACNAYCKHWVFDPCEAVMCDKSECRAVPRTKCEAPVGNGNNYGADANYLGAAGDACPPDFPVCEGSNGNMSYRTPPIPVSKFYQWKMPSRCAINLRENLRPSNRTDFIPRMLVQYRKVDRKCKGMYVYPPAISSLAGQTVESALNKLVEKRNAFYTLEECMSTCAE